MEHVNGVVVYANGRLAFGYRGWHFAKKYEWMAWGQSFYNAEMRSWEPYGDKQATDCSWKYYRWMTK